MRIRRRVRERQEKGEDKPPILEKMSAAIMRLFWVLHGEKLVGGECPG